MPIVVVLLAGFHLLSVPCAAEYLLNTARQFAMGDDTIRHFSTADLNNDGIADMTGLCGDYPTGYDEALVSRLGNGDGTFSDPSVIMVGDDFWTFDMGLLNDDPYPDCVAQCSIPDDWFIVFLGNGDGSFSTGETYLLDRSPGNTELRDFTGDGLTDCVIASYFDVYLYVGQGDGTFVEGTVSTYDERLSTLASGDFDEDGDLDLMGFDFSAERLWVLTNDGAGGFSIFFEKHLPYWLETTVAADLDGDGHLDMLSGNETYGRLVRCFGNGDGTFEDDVLISAGDDPEFWDLGDLDGDGDLDIVANDDGGVGFAPAMAVVLNDGTGNFGEPEYFFGMGEQVTLDDMDGDGNIDAVILTPDYYDFHREFFSILPGGGDGSFFSHVPLRFDDDQYSFAVADLDNDGDSDIVAGPNFFYESPEVQVYLNESPAGFSGPLSHDCGVNPFSLVTGDLDGDFLNDILVIGYYDNCLSTLINAGDGTFHTPVIHGVGDYPATAALGDLDGDGDLDVAVYHHSLYRLGIVLNNGDGTWGESVYYDTGWTVDVALGDLDGDDDLDIALDQPEDGGGNLVVLKNNGDGSFMAPQLFDVIDPVGVALDDHDGDGDLDMATASDTGQVLSVLLNHGDGSFAAPLVHQTGIPLGGGIVSGDMDLDGIADLVVLGIDTWEVVLFMGDGDGTFGPPVSFSTGLDFFDVQAADLDNDQDLELILGSVYQDFQLVYNNAADFEPSGLLVIGPGPGEFNPTLVRVYGVAAGRSYTEWHAYGVDRWGVNVALGELDGTAEPEVLTGAGPGAVFGPHVRGFQHDGAPLPGVSFLAYGTNKYGVNVCSGDLDNDGFDEIVTGAGPGAVFGPHVRGWNWDGAGSPTAIPGISYFAYGTPKWGVNVSCGDIDGDGYDEIVTGAGPGAVYGPHVRGWNCDGGGASSIPGVSFFAYGTLKYGVNVSCGDIDGDGIDEMVTGAGPGVVFGPHVRAWNWDGTGSVQSIGAVSFFAYDYTQWGANVSCGDLDNDGIDEIITGAGPGETYAPRVRGWNYDGQVLTALGGVDFNAYSTTEVTHGVKVGGLRN